MSDAPERPALRDLVLVLVVACLVRVVTGAHVADAPHTFAPVIDSEAYLIQALRVAGGHDIVDGVYFQAPLYPWVLGAVLAAAGHPGIAPGAETIADVAPDDLASALAIGRTFQAALGVALAALVWWLTSALFGRRAALAAGLFAAGYGPFAFYEGHLLKVSFALVLWPATVLAAVAALRADAPRRFVWVGLLLGAGALVRGNTQIVSALGLAVLVLGAWRAGRLRWGVTSAAWWVGGVLLAMAPVFARNTVVVGSPVVSTATPGTAFYLCNHKGNAVGMIEHIAINRQVPRYEQEDWQREAERRVGRELSPGEVSSYWLGQAWDEILADPGRYALAETRKAAMLFSRYEAPDNTQVALGADASWYLGWTPLRYGLLVPLALAGFVASWRRRREGARGEVALVVALVGYAGSLLLFTAVSRFRIPLAPLLMPYAGLGIATLLFDVRGRRAALAAGIVGLGLTFVSELPWPGPLDEREKARHLAVRLLNRAQVAFSTGDETAGVADLERAVDVSERAGTVSPTLYATLAGHRRVQAARAASRGDAAEAAALRAEAVRLLDDEAFAIDPDHGPANREAGLLLYETGNDALAVARFERALVATPGDRVARVYAALASLASGDATSAERHARALVDEWPDHDDGHGILVLALTTLGRDAEAREVLARYDALAARREAAGYRRRLDDQPAFAALRGDP